MDALLEIKQLNQEVGSGKELAQSCLKKSFIGRGFSEEEIKVPALI